MKFRIIEVEELDGVKYEIHFYRPGKPFRKPNWVNWFYMDSIHGSAYSSLDKAEKAMGDYIKGLEYPKIKVVKQIEIP